METELTPGHATTAGTERFRDRTKHQAGHFRAPDGLQLSSIGLGTRTGNPGGEDDMAYQSALPMLLGLGCNVFNTALSDRMQTSERSVGASLRLAFESDLATRDEVWVVSKGGYLTADPDKVRGSRGVRSYLVDTYIESGLADAESIVNGNCIDPQFLRYQIARSRRNLGLETIDLYCLQDP